MLLWVNYIIEVGPVSAFVDRVEALKERHLEVEKSIQLKLKDHIISHDLV